MDLWRRYKYIDVASLSKVIHARAWGAHVPPLPAKEGEHVNCPRCGAPLQPGMQFCASCGAQAGATAPPPAQQQHPQYAYPQQPYPPQPYPYQYPPAQPYQAPKDDSSSLGKVIIIIVVLLVVLVVVGAAVFYLFIASVEDIVGDQGLTTVSLQAPSPSARQIDGTTYWDMGFTVNRIAPSTAEVTWSEVMVTVKSSIGAVLLAQTPPFVDNPLAYDDAADGTVGVQAWFVDADDDGVISSGDSIKLTGLTAAYEGGQFELRLGLRLIAASAIPSNFPG